MTPKAKTKIEVTERDIIYGSPGDPCGCMIARAIRRACRIRGVSVYPNGISTGSICFTKHVEASLPVRANKAALAFDKCGSPHLNLRGRARLKQVKPFSFTLPKPKKFSELP